MMRKTTVWFFGWALTFLSLGGCAGKHQKTRDQIQALQSEAFADALRGEPDAARQRLLEAERLGNIVGLGADPLMIRTQMALGAIYAQNFNDEKRAVAYMSEALARNRDAKLPSGMGTLKARQALALARQKSNSPSEVATVAAMEESPVGGATAAAPPSTAVPGSAPTAASSIPPAATPPPAPAAPESAPAPGSASAAASIPSPGTAAAPVPPPPPAQAPAVSRDAELAELLKVPPVKEPTASSPSSALPPPAPPIDTEGAVDCPIPLEAPPDVDVVLRCSVRPEVGVSHLVLSYRPAGTERFTQVTMPRRGNGTYQGVVPASATNGKSLQFFVETSGPVKARAGSAESPNLLIVKPGAAPIGAPSEGGAGTGGDVRASNADPENPLAAQEAERALANLRRRPPRRFWVSLGLGTGYGWQPGGRLEFRREREIGAGTLPGGMFHFMPEFGYQLLDRLSVSLQARLQYAPIEGPADPAGGTPAGRASAVLARAAYTFGPGPFQALASVCFGGGDGFRLRVPRDRGVELGRSDTVRGGPLLIGAGGGVVYHFAKRFAVPLETRVLVGFPSSAVVVEAGLGVAYTF